MSRQRKPTMTSQARCASAGEASPSTGRRQLCLLGLGTALLGLAPSAQAAGPVLQGITENLPPLNFEDKGQAQGFSVRLLGMMAADTGLELRTEVLPWVRAMQTAQSTPNSLLFSLTRTPERESQFQWIGPISERRIVLYQLQREAPIKIQSLAELKAYRTGVVRESAAARHLQEQGFQPGRELEIAIDDGSNVRKLLARRMDLMVMLDWAAAWHLHQLKLPFDTLRAVTVADTQRSYWYGMRLDTDPALVARLQTALDRIRADGRYDKLRAEYFR